jgi:hypothetical protein
VNDLALENNVNIDDSIQHTYNLRNDLVPKSRIGTEVLEGKKEPEIRRR